MSSSGPKTDYKGLWDSYLTRIADTGRSQTVQKSNTRASLAAKGVLPSSDLWQTLLTDAESTAQIEREAVESGAAASALASFFIPQTTTIAEAGVEVEPPKPTYPSTLVSQLSEFLGRAPKDWELAAASKFGMEAAVTESVYNKTPTEKAQARAERRGAAGLYGTEDVVDTPWL